jgi:hypothetical protein
MSIYIQIDMHSKIWKKNDEHTYILITIHKYVNLYLHVHTCIYS